MTPQERERRIKRLNALRLRARVQARAATDEFLAEVEAAGTDPEAKVTQRRAASLTGMTQQTLNEMVMAYRARQARQADESEQAEAAGGGIRW